MPSRPPLACATRPQRVLVLGSGFGGLYVALRLQKLLRGTEHEVLLVNRENFFSFTPMLHEVAAGDLDLTHIVNPVRKLLAGVRFFLGDVEAVDLARRTVTVTHGSDRHAHALDYDQLVIALGATTNFHGLPGLAERALTMKSLGDAIRLRNHLIASLEEADTECAARAGLRPALTTCVVAGGGFAGVETLASVNDFAREALRFYPHLRQQDLRMVLVHSGDEILPELDPRLGRYARRKLAARGVDIRLGTRVLGVSDAGVALSDGTTIPTRTLVWTAGTSPHPLLATLPCPRERGRLAVDEFLELRGHPGVWALGDCACIPGPDGTPYPPTAQHAVREGRVLAENLVATLAGRRKRAFRFTTLGQLATIGRHAGVAQIGGLRFSGFVAWWLWRTIYLAKLPRADKKLRVMIDWTLDLLFSKDLVQYATATSPTLSLADVEAEPSPRAAPRPREGGPMHTLVTLRTLLLDLTARLRFLPPLLARLAVGAVFVQTGWGKLHNLEQVTDFFRSLGIPAPELQAPLVASVELVGGAMILLGLGARLAAVPLMATMVVATLTAVWPNVEGGVLELLGKVEVLYLILFAWIAVAGPGAVSLDALLARRLERRRRPLPGGAPRAVLSSPRSA